MVERTPDPDRRRFRVIPGLHIVTDDAVLNRDGFISDALAVLEEGGEDVALHLRGPRTHGRRIFELAEELRGPAEAAGGLLLVNDRLDVVVALDLRGGHLGQRSLPPGVARELLGPNRTLGFSVHGSSEVERAVDGNVDFLIVGTIFPTLSHPQGVPAGVDRIEEVVEVSSLPMVGIGGITPQRVGEVLASGARGVAVRGAIWDVADPGEAVGVFLKELTRNPEQTRMGEE